MMLQPCEPTGQGMTSFIEQNHSTPLPGTKSGASVFNKALTPYTQSPLRSLLFLLLHLNKWAISTVLPDFSPYSAFLSVRLAKECNVFLILLNCSFISSNSFWCIFFLLSNRFLS